MNFDEVDRSQAKLIDLQAKSSELFDAFDEIDTAMLRSSNVQDRALQAELRYRLYEYVNQIWAEPERATQGEVHPANLPAYAGVGALRDLVMALWVNAQEAQRDSGDPVESIHVETSVTLEGDG